MKQVALVKARSVRAGDVLRLWNREYLVVSTRIEDGAKYPGSGGDFTVIEVREPASGEHTEAALPHDLLTPKVEEINAFTMFFDKYALKFSVLAIISGGSLALGVYLGAM